MNEAVAGETVEETEDERSSMVAYVGRASFKLVPAPVPGNDNHENTLRIRIPAPQSEITEAALVERKKLLSGVVSVLVRRLEVPRWILVTMTLLVFATGVAVAMSIVGGARPTYAHTAPPAPTPAPARPMLALEPLPIAPVAPPDRTVALHREAKPAATPTPVRRTRKSAAPRPSSGGSARPEAIAAPWVDPFAE
jgi:hypothetical protein